MHKRLVNFENFENKNLVDKMGRKLEVILFYWDTHLRSHAIDHLGNFTELSDWKKVGKIDVDKIILSIDRIKDIGCPYFTEDEGSPPCFGKSGKCVKWKQCSPHAAYIEDRYLSCCQKVLEEGCETPMLAVFYNYSTQKKFWAMGRNKIVALCLFIKNNYTLKTCYRPKQGAKITWKEIRDHMITKIHFEAVGKTCWITDETWRTAPRKNVSKWKRRGRKGRRYRKKR